MFLHGHEAAVWREENEGDLITLAQVKDDQDPFSRWFSTIFVGRFHRLLGHRMKVASKMEQQPKQKCRCLTAKAEIDRRRCRKRPDGLRRCWPLHNYWLLERSDRRVAANGIDPGPILCHQASVPIVHRRRLFSNIFCKSCNILKSSEDRDLRGNGSVSPCPAISCSC